MWSYMDPKWDQKKGLKLFFSVKFNCGKRRYAKIYYAFKARKL
jgi:hypothetical protein